MSRLVFDYDPLSKTTTYFDYDESNPGKFALTYSQDVTADLKRAEGLRQIYGNSKEGIKNDWWHYAIVPVGIQYQMLYEDGVNYWDKNDGPKVLQLLNTKYKRFKVTELTHNIKNGL